MTGWGREAHSAAAHLPPRCGLAPKPQVRGIFYSDGLSTLPSVPLETSVPLCADIVINNFKMFIFFNLYKNYIYCFYTKGNG